MNATITRLEDFIDAHYHSISMSQAEPTPSCASSDLEDLGDQAISATQTPTEMNEGITRAVLMRLGKKRKTISPISNTTEDVIDLNEDQQIIHDAVVNTVTSWVSEFMTSLQESFNAQFEEATEEMKGELSEKISRAEIEEPGDVTEALNRQAKEIDDLVAENEELLNKCRVIEGRLTRAEKELEDVKEEMMQQEARSMRDNLKFFNVPEVRGEDCERTLRDFLRTEMKVSDENMSLINFDRVHRTGKMARDHDRVIIAKFNPSKGRQIVLSHAKNLVRGRGYGVSEQLPRELAERKKQMLPTYKEAKQQNRNPKWSLDKVVINGKTSAIVKDKVKDININTTEKAVSLQHVIHHTPPEHLQGSSFQGHSVHINNQDEIVPALHAIYSESRMF